MIRIAQSTWHTFSINFPRTNNRRRNSKRKRQATIHLTMYHHNLHHGRIKFLNSSHSTNLFTSHTSRFYSRFHGLNVTRPIIVTNGRVSTSQLRHILARNLFVRHRSRDNYTIFNTRHRNALRVSNQREVFRVRRTFR